MDLSSDALYVLGHPVAHSKSPVMHNALFSALGLSWTYGRADIAGQAEARAFIEAREFAALNITMPYKPLAAEIATVRAASATLARGANVLVRKDAELIAYNVDGAGCVSYLERVGADFRDARVVVCGCGPTSLAIVHAAAQAGAAEVVLVGRDKDRARRAMEAYAETFAHLAATAIDMPAAHDHHLGFREAYDHVQLKFGSYDTSRTALSSADVIVDATPLGMQPGDAAPFDADVLSARQLVLDVVYGHGETALLAAARKRGCAAFDGAGMLVAQAVATAGIVFDIRGVDCALSFDEMFDIMADAAGFDLAARE